MVTVLAFMQLSFASGDYKLSPLQGRNIQIEKGEKGNLIIFLKDIA